MVEVTAALLINILHLDAAFDDATMENMIDQAIDSLNLYGEIDIPNMAGTAGSKTVSLTSPQKAAVINTVRTVYNSLYENRGDATQLAGVSLSSSLDTTALHEIKRQAKLLYRRENPTEVSIG